MGSVRAALRWRDRGLSLRARSSATARRRLTGQRHHRYACRSSLGRPMSFSSPLASRRPAAMSSRKRQTRTDNEIGAEARTSATASFDEFQLSPRNAFISLGSNTVTGSRAMFSPSKNRRPSPGTSRSASHRGVVHLPRRALPAPQRYHHEQRRLQRVGSEPQGSDDDGGGDRPAWCITR